MFKRGDKVRIVKMIIIEGDLFNGIKNAFPCIGKEGKIDTVYSGNSLPYYVKMDDENLWASLWREEELERV